MAKLSDVAAEAGVSLATASIVVSGKAAEKRISEETAARVFSAAEKLQYVHSRTAQTKKTSGRKRKVVALYWPLESTLLSGMAGDELYRANEEQRAGVEIITIRYRPGRLEEHMWMLLSGMVDGGIIGGIIQADLEYLETLTPPVPIVLLDRHSNKYSTVNVNSSAIAFQVAILLNKKHCDACALIGSSVRQPGMAERSSIFLTACRQFGIRIQKNWIFYDENLPRGGAEATERYLMTPDAPKVVFYESDLLAQGGIHTFRKHGIRVPQDVEIIASGHTNREYRRFMTPTITCVSVPEEMYVQAFLTLIRHMNDITTPRLHVEVEPTVQIGETFVLSSSD